MAAKSTSVPKGWEDFYAGINGITDEFCAEHLNDEYAQLIRFATAAMCRKKPSPLHSGKLLTWCCAIVYAIGQVNFLSDKDSEPYMAMADVASYFGVAPSTAGNKAKAVRDALKIRDYDPNWTLPSRLLDHPYAWMIIVDGYPYDARSLPLEIQKYAAKKGMVPFVVTPQMLEERAQKREMRKTAKAKPASQQSGSDQQASLLDGLEG